MNIQEDYVSFETAKLLKEKGFDAGCNSYFISDNEIALIPNRRNFNNHGVYLSAPTHQMVMKWLREEKGIAIVPILSSVLDNERFLWDIEIAAAKTNKTYHQGWIYESYERACEAAIKYCLENLI